MVVVVVLLRVRGCGGAVAGAGAVRILMRVRVLMRAVQCRLRCQFFVGIFFAIFLLFMLLVRPPLFILHIPTIHVWHGPPPLPTPSLLHPPPTLHIHVYVACVFSSKKYVPLCLGLGKESGNSPRGQYFRRFGRLQHYFL